MEEKKFSNAKRAVLIVTVLTFVVAFFELIFAFTQYQQGMTIGDVASYVTNKHHIYLLLLIIANLGLLPSALLLNSQDRSSYHSDVMPRFIRRFLPCVVTDSTCITLRKIPSQ